MKGKRNRRILKMMENKDKLHFSSVNLLKQANSEDVLKSPMNSKKVKESLKDVIASITLMHD